MRTLALSLASFVLLACGGLGDPAPDPAPGAPVHRLTLPVQYAPSHEVMVYAKLDGGQATELTELSYGLADGYPGQVTVQTRQGYVLSNTCALGLGAVTWTSIAEVQGTAAKLDLGGGRLTVDLREEGTVSALLVGQIEGLRCTAEDGSTVTSFPLRHRVVLHVHRVAGFVVDQFHQRLYGCGDTVVLPAGASLWAPVAHPLDGAGGRFEAANAPAPATITLQSDGDLALVDGEVGHLRAGVGVVSVSLDTALPVQGLRSFEVVGPGALTQVQAALYLSKAAAKGSVSERIAAGMSYRIFFPEGRNVVEVRVDAAVTARGKLCDNVPGAWFASTSSTPDQCAAGGDGTEDVSAFVVVAAVRAPGECRLEVTVPGTGQRWTTNFDTTR